MSDVSFWIIDVRTNYKIYLDFTIFLNVMSGSHALSCGIDRFFFGVQARDGCSCYCYGSASTNILSLNMFLWIT